MDNNVVNNFVKVTQEHKHVVVKGAGGLRGVQGPAGAGLQISGSVATYADLPWQLTIYDAGKAYFVQADGLLYVWTGERWPNEGDGAEFVGPQGEPGYSPQATVTKVGDTATITITDRDGTTTATVSDGTTPVIDDSLSLLSENPVQNKVVTSAINGKQATLQAGDITTSLLADESVTEAKLADGSVTTSKIGSQSVTEGIIADGAVTTDKLGFAWNNIDDLFYKSGDVVSSGDGTSYVEVFNGFLTTGNSDLVITIPMSKRLDNITSAAITALNGDYRCQGAYLTGNGTDITTLSSQTIAISKATNTIIVTFRKTSGTWGATNNSTVSLGIKTFSITLS